MLSSKQVLNLLSLVRECGQYTVVSRRRWVREIASMDTSLTFAVILQSRIYAIYEKSKMILIINGIFFALEIVSTLVIFNEVLDNDTSVSLAFTYRDSVADIRPKVIKVPVGCAKLVQTYTFAGYIPGSAVD